MTNQPEPIDLGEIDVSETAEIAAVFTRSIEAGQLRHPFDSPFGSVTDGGLAEAGWQPVGYVADDGPTLRPEP